MTQGITRDIPTGENSALYAGIDVGGTSIKWRIVNTAGQIHDEGRTPTDTAHPGEQIGELAAYMTGQHPRIAGIGVVCPGIINEETGEVLYASNLNFDHVNLKEIVSRAACRPTEVKHDGRAASIAEALMGAGRGASSFLMMPIGTGISVAAYLDGKPWSGATFSAGEIGHTPTFPGGEHCSCGQSGCLEVYASAQGIARRYREASGSDIGTKEVEKRLSVDPLAQQVWSQAVEALALSLTQLTLAFDPQRIIIGGGLSHAGEVLLAPLRDRLTSALKWREIPEIVPAQLGGQSGSWGAVIVAAHAAGAVGVENQGTPQPTQWHLPW